MNMGSSRRSNCEKTSAIKRKSPHTAFCRQEAKFQHIDTLHIDIHFKLWAPSLSRQDPWRVSVTILGLCNFNYYKVLCQSQVCPDNKNSLHLFTTDLQNQRHEALRLRRTDDLHFCFPSTSLADSSHFSHIYDVLPQHHADRTPVA